MAYFLRHLFYGLLFLLRVPCVITAFVVDVDWTIPGGTLLFRYVDYDCCDLCPLLLIVDYLHVDCGGVGGR